MRKRGRGIQTGAVLYFGGTLSQIFQVTSDILKQITCWDDDDELKYDDYQDSSYLVLLWFHVCPISCPGAFPALTCSPWVLLPAP